MGADIPVAIVLARRPSSRTSRLSPAKDHAMLDGHDSLSKKSGAQIDDWDDWPAVAERSSGHWVSPIRFPTRLENLALVLISAIADRADQAKGGRRPPPVCQGVAVKGRSRAHRGSRSGRFPGITLLELVVIIAIVGVLVALLLPPVQSGGPPPRFPPPRRLAQPWPPQLSGEYDRSYSRRSDSERLETLDILLDGRYLRRFTGRHGLTGVSGYATGTASQLVLDHPRPSKHRGPQTYLAIRWGSRDYLVEEEEVADFCAAINDGSEPRTKPAGRFYLRHGDWNKPVAGIPALPEPCRARIERHE